MVADGIDLGFDSVRHLISGVVRIPWQHLWTFCGAYCLSFFPRNWYRVSFDSLPCYVDVALIDVSGEYPAGSVACAESTGELKSGHRNRWFIMFTNVQIDFGFVVAAFVPMILVLIFSETHLHAAWRVALGLGFLPPLSLLYLRLKLNEPEEFKRESMANTRTPWWLVIK